MLTVLALLDFVVTTFSDHNNYLLLVSTGEDNVIITDGREVQQCESNTQTVMKMGLSITAGCKCCI